MRIEAAAMEEGDLPSRNWLALVAMSVAELIISCDNFSFEQKRLCTKKHTCTHTHAPHIIIHQNAKQSGHTKKKKESKSRVERKEGKPFGIVVWEGKRDDDDDECIPQDWGQTCGW